MKNKIRKHNPVSLFAFQDVMASVIGILFFVVLLMALDLIDQKPSAAQALEELPEIETLKKTLDELQQQHKSIEAEYEKLILRQNLTSKSKWQIDREIDEINNEVLRMHNRIEKQIEELLQLENDSAELATRNNESLEKLESFNKQLDDIRAEIVTAQARPTVTYIIDKNDSLVPWLLEVTDSSLSVATPDGRTIVLRFLAEDFRDRKRDFLDWAYTLTPDKYYFVILEKPSGLSFIHEIEKDLAKRGFSIGNDLIPEDMMVFQGGS